MSAQLLSQTQISEEKKPHLLTTIESSAKRGAALVKQVLSFARGVEGQRTALQIRHLISEIQQIIRETFPKLIDVHTNISQDLWMVSGDATQLHQVLINLCVNARDAMPRGGTLSMSAGNKLIDESYARMNLDAHVGSYVVFTVKDTGVGMSPEVLERIFEPFFTTKELGKGTGLGLSTVLSIVKSHGGFLEVTSTVDEGTQISVYLPAIEATQIPQISDSEFSQGKGELILVVDDEAAIRETTKTSLEAYNYRVLTANDGIDAIALYAQHKEEISLVLVDMMMPAMDGATTIRTLKKINPQVKMIAVSGLVCSTQLSASTLSGVHAFLSKPYTTNDLLKTINEVILLSLKFATNLAPPNRA
jgi:CheY-like chemotaxis protein